MGMYYWHTLTPWDWVGLGIIFFISDFFIATSGFLIWLGLVACAVGLILGLFPLLSWPYQLLIFSLGGIVCSVSWWAYLLHHPNQKKLKKLQANRYINQTFVLAAPIIDGKGTLMIDDISWAIKGPELPVGTSVCVVSVKGIVLQVEKVS